MPRKNKKNNVGSSGKSRSTSEGSSSIYFESPYKNLLSKIQYIGLKNDGEDDFRTPVKTIPKLVKQPPTRNKSLAKRTSKLKQSKLVVKRTEDNIMHLDVNPDHLLTALALSKSTFEQEYPSTSTDNSEPTFLNPNEIPAIPTLLERYGFRTSKLHRHEISFDRSESVTKRRPRKFRYVTPILHTRCSEDRTSLINSKVKCLLSLQDNIPQDVTDIISYAPCINSTYLQEYVSEQKCWKINATNESNYTCQSLKFSPTKSTAGYLLKDWNHIPGRENDKKILDPENRTEKLFNEEFEKPNESDNISFECESNVRVKSFTCSNDNVNKELEVITQNENASVSDNIVDSGICSVDINVNKELENIFNKDGNKLEVNDHVEQCRIESGSPDLFDSDDESKNLKSFCNDGFEEVLSLNRSAPYKETTLNGSCFNINEELADTGTTTAEEACIDLTQDSDEDIESLNNKEKMSPDLSHKQEQNMLSPVICSQRDSTDSNDSIIELKDEELHCPNKTGSQEKREFQYFNKFDESVRTAPDTEENEPVDLKKMSPDFRLEQEQNRLNPEISNHNADSNNSIIELNDELHCSNKSNSQEERECHYFNKFDEFVKTASDTEENKHIDLEKMSPDFCFHQEQNKLNPEIPNQSRSTDSNNSIIELNDEVLHCSNKSNSQEEREYHYFNKFDKIVRTSSDTEENEPVDLEKVSPYFCLEQEQNQLNPEISSQSHSTDSNNSIIELNDEELRCPSQTGSQEEREFHYFKKIDEFVRTTHDTEENETVDLEETEKDCSLKEEQISVNRDLSSQSQSTCSQDSIIVLSDEELNYSSKLSVKHHRGFYDLSNFDDISGICIDKEEVDAMHLELKNKYSQKKEEAIYKDIAINNEEVIIDEPLEGINFEENKTYENLASATTSDKNMVVKNSPIIEENYIKETFPTVTPPKENGVINKSFRSINSNVTAINNDVPKLISEKRCDIATSNAAGNSFTITPDKHLIIKTSNVTPIADYDNMDTPTIRAELDKFGIKPLKRRRGIQLLKYIYETTHPYVDDVENISEERSVKRRKLSSNFENKENSIKIVGESIIQGEREDDLIFERKSSKKIFSCRLPLQVAWYNFLCCNPSLAENIVLYEPIQLEVIHSMLKEQTRCNFHIEDLITFLDKKCITFRTNQWKGARAK